MTETKITDLTSLQPGDLLRKRLNKSEFSSIVSGPFIDKAAAELENRRFIVVGVTKKYLSLLLIPELKIEKTSATVLPRTIFYYRIDNAEKE